MPPVNFNQYPSDRIAMERLLERLFAEAPKMTDGAGKPDDTQAPALNCHIILRSGQMLQGSMSVTAEGLLKIGTVAEVPDPSAKASSFGGSHTKKLVLAEQFFSVNDLVCVAVERDIKQSGPRIHT